MRPSRIEWAMSIARETSRQSTCLRRHVGCVLLNIRGHVLATGYNGVAAGLPHCNELGKDVFDQAIFPWSCSGATSKSGTNLDGCQAIHAEQNALLQCHDVYQIHQCVVTASPCMTCTKLLLNTSCQEIYFSEEYPQPEARELWESANRRVVKIIL